MHSAYKTCLQTRITHKHWEIYKQFTKICVLYKTHTVRIFVQLYLPFKYSHQIHTNSMQSSRFLKWTLVNVCCSINYNRINTKHIHIIRCLYGGACNKIVWPKILSTNQDEWILFIWFLYLQIYIYIWYSTKEEKNTQKQLCNIC